MRASSLAIAISSLLLSGGIGVSAATPDLAAGARHSVSLSADGSVRTWGFNSAGELGLGTDASSASPTPVAGLTGIAAVSAGCGHVLALRSDGTVLAWGANDVGQLGNGTTTDQSIPVPVAQLTDVTAISAGCAHSVALKRDGTVWSWGLGSSGQLGDGIGQTRTTPVAALGVNDAVAISAGHQHTVMLSRAGFAWAWGYNNAGQLGPGSTIPFQLTRVRADLGSVVAIAAGRDFTLALRDDGTVWSWGSNGYMVLGIPIPPVLRGRPDPVPGVTNVSAIAAGQMHGLALRRDGTVMAWGRNETGQLGNGAFTVSHLPASVPQLSGVQSVAAGVGHSLAIKSDGTVWAWGDNRFGELGEGSFTNRAMPVQVPGLVGVRRLAGGGTTSASFTIPAAHTVALGVDGTVLTWGSNSQGQLGNGSTPRRAVPSIVPTLSNVVGIDAGADFSLAVRADGVVLAWGSNVLGQLGDGSLVNRSAPVGVALPSGATAVAAGFAHGAAILADRTLWTWGYNGSGQLGDGTFVTKGSPVFTGLTDVAAVAGGGAHTIAAKRDGSLWGWGSNLFGSLGLSGTARRTRPEQIPFMAAIAVAVEGDVSTVLRSDGTVWSFGPMDGEAYYTPEPVTGLSDVIAISGRAALKRDGTVWRWKPEGEINPNTPQHGRLVAIPVPEFTGAAGLSRGVGGLRMVRRADGSVIAVGSNRFGWLGDGTFLDRSLPVVVVRENGEGSLETNDWFLDLDPAVGGAIPSDKTPVFLTVARDSSGSISADLRFRAQDINTQGSVFSFALAPADIVRPAANGEPAFEVGKTISTTGSKEAAIACVLAQLNASGQLQAVSASSLQAFVTGVLGAQGQSVAVISGSTVNIGGATFFVGYGTNAQSMINGGINRGVVTIPGAKECRPQAPKTGWWWYPPESGRGYSIEVAGRNIFYAAFLYDDAGRSKWYVATGPASLDGSLFTGDLLEVLGGQTLFGDYKGPSTLQSVGPITLAFNTESTGTQVWPGGTIPIERFNIVPNGLTAPPQANVPENGWWWNPDESGRGFFLEWQNGSVDIAGYMYDDVGNAVWYLTVVPTPDPRSIVASWWTFGGGQTLTSAYRPNTQTSNNFAPLAVSFDSPSSGTLTLPGGRTTRIVRHRF